MFQNASVSESKYQEQEIILTVRRVHDEELEILDANKLQLVEVSAMFIANKIEKMYAPEINMFATDNAYTTAEIRQMELRANKEM